MKKKKYEFADQEIIKNFEAQISEIISLFDLRSDECMITDETKVSDFEELEINKSKLSAFKIKYNFIPEPYQYLYEIAQKMVCKRII